MFSGSAEQCVLLIITRPRRGGLDCLFVFKIDYTFYTKFHFHVMRVSTISFGSLDTHTHKQTIMSHKHNVIDIK